MALTADQQAMLQLILERGQSYEDIAGVLGVGVDDVRSRSRAALAELAGTDPDSEVGLTDFLLGQADPIGRADAVRHLQADPGSRQLAAELSDRLRELAPGAQLPELPKQRERRGVLGRRKRPVEAGAESGTPAPETEAISGERPRGAGARLRDTLSRRQQQAIVALAASAVLVVVAVLAISGAFGGGEDTASSGETQPTTAAEQDVIESVILEPQSGGDASGEATFGIATGDQPYVDVQLSGLDPPQQGGTHVIWLLLTENEGYPLSPLQVSADGSFSDRFPIPQFAIPIASRARFVDVSLSDNRSLLSKLRSAVQDQKPILGYDGESVLRGEIPAAAQGQGQGAPGAAGGAGG
jgi:hypothetical protein